MGLPQESFSKICEKLKNKLAEKNKTKIALAASAGGHLTQLLKLKDAYKEREAFSVTTNEYVRSKLKSFGKVYVVGECNRQQPFKVFAVFFKCLKIILTEKPNIVISTGAASGCMCCFIAKILGAKIIQRYLVLFSL